MAFIGTDERSNHNHTSDARGHHDADQCMVRWIWKLATIAALALLVSSTAACGGGTPKPVAPANDETAELVLLVKGTSKVGPQIQAKLRAAGYQVVSDAATEHDAVVNVSEETVQNKSLITVKVNGQEQVSYTTHLTLSLVSDGVTLATSSAEFDTEDGIDADDLERIVGAITEKSIVTKLARDVRQEKNQVASAAKKKEKKEAARKRAEEEAAKKKARQEDEAAWAQVVVAECTTPRDKAACDKVKGYLSKFPTGQHAVEGRAALEKGAAAIGIMLDERAWNAANVRACKEPKESTDCDGLKKYSKDYPSGAHVAEAREAIDATREKIRKLAAKEEKEAERETRRLEAEEKKAQRAECKKECRAECKYARLGMFDACVNRCVKASCD